MISTPLHRLAVVGLLLTVVSTPAIASVDYSARPSVHQQIEDTAAFEAWLDETMAAQLERHHVPGATVVVVEGDDVLLAKGYGYADLEADR